MGKVFMVSCLERSVNRLHTLHSTFDGAKTSGLVYLLRQSNSVEGLLPSKIDGPKSSEKSEISSTFVDFALKLDTFETKEKEVHSKF